MRNHVMRTPVPALALPAIQCNGCTLCCRLVWIPLSAEEDPAGYDTELVEGTHVLKHKLNGECVYLGKSGCTIYDRRPEVCRRFDCRAWAARFNMKTWKLLVKRYHTLVDLPVVRHGKKLLRELQCPAPRKLI